MKKIKRNLKWITIAIVMIILLGGIILKNTLKGQATKEPEEELIFEKPLEEPSETSIPKTFYIDIKGAIKTPGVYEIKEGQKVIDAVQLAGGFTENADSSMINLAKQVTNEMVIIIYTKEEVKKAQEKDSIAKTIDNQCICPTIKNDACLIKEETKTNKNKTSEKQPTQTSEKININTASLEELQTITGIGESKAKAIIEYREEHGNFQSIEEIKEVSGIGESLYEKVKNSITI